MLAADTIIAGKYRLKGTLGEGGMAVVYQAEHLEVGLQVAIKVMHRDFSRHDAFLERFRREARAAATIGHDNVVKVLDYGVHDEQPFMVMELLRGESLATRLEREPRLPVQTACNIVAQILMALDAAAGAKIVHRDLKPENVFLTSHGMQEDFVKLLDFGISKFGAAEDRDDASHQTRPGALMGTPHYMAPEQAKAQPNIDSRADLYSVGVMLYEMLTGERPFNAPSEAEIIAMICYRPHEPAPARELNADIPEALEAAITRSIAHKADDRFQSAAEMLEAIRPFADELLFNKGSRTAQFQAISLPRSSQTPTEWSGRPITSPRKGAGLETLAEKPSHRRITPWVVVGSVALAAAVGLTTLTTRNRPDARATVSAAGDQVRIELAGMPENAQASIDGRVVSGSVVMLTRGIRHALRVETPGRTPFETTIVPQEATTVQVVMPEIVAAPAPAPVAPTPPVVAPAAMTPVVPAAMAPAAPAAVANPPSDHPAGDGTNTRSSRHTRSGGEGRVRSTGSFVSGTSEY